jgi:hypothetical protein
MKYTIHWTDTRPSFQEQWNSRVWQKAETLQVAHFHPQSSSHRPKTQAKLLYDDEGIYVIFRVEDRYVKAVHENYQDPVCQDSCVEFFVMPCGFVNYTSLSSVTSPCENYQGYFNFEVNCIGTMLLYYIEDHRRTPDGFAKYDPVQEILANRITVFHSLSGPIEEEITTPVDWVVGYQIPFSIFESYLGPLDIRQGRGWRVNFYKCGDRTSHPHWASWKPIGEELNFHQPARFGALEFGM